MSKDWHIVERIIEVASTGHANDQLANRPVLVAAGSSCFTTAAAVPDYPSALFQAIDLRRDREESQPAGVDGEKLLLPRSIALAESARC